MVQDVGDQDFGLMDKVTELLARKAKLVEELKAINNEAQEQQQHAEDGGFDKSFQMKYANKVAEVQTLCLVSVQVLMLMHATRRLVNEAGACESVTQHEACMLCSYVKWHGAHLSHAFAREHCPVVTCCPMRKLPETCALCSSRQSTLSWQGHAAL
jgi:hypothetical protein